MNFKIKALSALFGLAMASAASAGTVFYTDSATYAKSVTSAPAITFDNGTNQAYRGTSYTDSGVTFTANSAIYSIYAVDYDSVFHTSGYLDLEGNALSMTFGPTNALSFQFGGFYDTVVNLNLTFSNGATFVAQSPQHGYAFFGVTSDAKLSHLSISTNNAYTAFDNVALGTVNVPEPGSVSLLGLALFGLVAARRKFAK